MFRTFARFLCVGATASFALVMSTREVARRYVFPVDEITRAGVEEGFLTHALRASDGASVHALELPASADEDTVVVFHNNRETAEAQAPLARALHARGFGVVVVEYRGYGRSASESPSEDGLYLDATAALDMLEERGVGADRVVLFGTSLGTGVAAEMARRGRGSRLVLVTPYTSIPDVVADTVPLLPWDLLVGEHFDTLAKAPRIEVPTLVIHGDADEIVPYSMGQRLARAIPNAKLHTVPGGRHGDLFARAGDRLLFEIEGFARRIQRRRG